MTHTRALGMPQVPVLCHPAMTHTRSLGMPQVPVLFHPAVAAFISHGGMGSTNEGTAAGKPILCLPFLADQPINAQHIVNKGSGLALDPKKCVTGWGAGGTSGVYQDVGVGGTWGGVSRRGGRGYLGCVST